MLLYLNTNDRITINHAAIHRIRLSLPKNNIVTFYLLLSGRELPKTTDI